ncbi:MAG: hypothetical protein JW804_02935 [Sedimentisphaerales bacterium]|nr:hypothetical protein [Sedimentisphaerales bacterium]
MKLMKIFILIVLTSVAAQVNAYGDEENYWEIIKQKMVECENATREDAEVLSIEFQRYIASLSAGQLLIATRDCAAEVQQRITPERWTEGLWAMGFFLHYYPQKTNNVEDVSPLLNDLKDKSQPEFWRYCIMQSFGEWRKEFVRPKQCFDAANMMRDIFTDSSEPEKLREQAVSEFKELYFRAYENNINNDPNVKQLVESGRTYEQVKGDIEGGRVRLADETVEMKKQIETAIAQSIQYQLKFFAEPNMPVYLGGEVIATLAQLRGFDETGQIKQTMNNALKNYKNYNQKLWHQLARTNIVYFNNEEAESILENMIDEAKDVYSDSRRFLNRSHLVYLKKRIEKGEMKKASAPVRLVKLPEPEQQLVQAAPVEVNEVVVDVNELVRWLEQIWLEDESIREVLDANELQEFIETVKELK